MLKTISGYEIEFNNVPFQHKYSIPKLQSFNEHEIVLIDSEVNDLLKKGAIAPTLEEKGQFISNIFLVKKKNNKYRPVINLKKLNEFIEYHHFKQETLDYILKSIKRNSYFTSLDLSEAYFSISIHHDFRKYLKFYWRNQLYAFQCLPFGISSAPRVFTKVMKVVFSHIRSYGISSFFYIDDSLYQEADYQMAVNNTLMVQNFMESLGFVINKEKSTFIPTHRIIFLGHLIDSVAFKVFLPEDKIEKILVLSKSLLIKNQIRIRNLAKLIGLYSSASLAILYAHLHHRYLDIDKIRALSISGHNFDAFTVLSEEAKNEIKWWIDNVVELNGRPIRNTQHIFYLETDASLHGWGAVFGKNSTQGRWNEEESLMHINVLELKAVLFSIKSLCCHLQNVHICIKSDSSTAVNYINNQGGSVLPLLEITKQLWGWCAEKHIFISSVHIPGKLNTGPDNLSRHFSDTSEYKLKETVFHRVIKRFFMPDIDLFASRLNAQLDNFVSWFPDPEALYVDAFSFSWHELTPYIFPPFSQIPMILQKIEDDMVRKAILIAPFWTTQLWFPKLLHCLVDFPVKLPICSDLLRLVHNGKFHPMNKRKLFLIACIISGDTSLIRDFQSQLPILSSILGESQLTHSMNIHGDCGYFGVIQNKLIHLNHL